jgi:type IV pilus assembly protein PilQ
MNQLKKAIGRSMQFVAAIFAASLLMSGAAQGADMQNSIQALGVSNGPNGQLIIKVSLKNAPAALPHDFTVNTPPRIAFDFPNTTNGLGRSVQEFNQGNLRSANVVQAGNRTRLVVNLSQMMAYTTKISGNDLLISLQPASGADAVIGSRFSEAKAGEQKHSLRDVDFHRGKNGEARIQVDLSDPNVGIDIKQQGKNLIVDFANTALPRNLQHKLDVVDFGTPVNFIDTFTQGKNVRMVIEPKGNWEHAAYQTDNKFVVEVKPVSEKQKADAAGKTGYTGEKLTLNFQNISVREALNVIADFTGLNIVISDTVNGNLTLRLKDVPWDQALDIILQSRGLDMRRNGNVIQVAPRQEIAAREKLALSASQEISDLEATRTESFQLSYQQGKDIIKLLTNKDQRILSKRGSAVVDARTNTLFVQDTPSRLEEVRKLIKQIDVPVRQVMIEARFVSAGDSFNRTLGGRLSYGSTKAQGFAVGSNTPTATRGTISGGSVNLPGAASGTGGLTLSLFNPAATNTLTLELTASELDGRTKNIASPRVVTADKTEATISSGVQIPYQQATSSGATSVAFKDATLSLKVTPQITPDDHINMKLEVNQDTVGTVYSGVPSINTKKVSTNVLVDNGGTVVIGGVYTQDLSNSVQKVPLLGDIPVVGWMFKNDNKTDTKSELLVFITPKILKESLSMK